TKNNTGASVFPSGIYKSSRCWTGSASGPVSYAMLATVFTAYWPCGADGVAPTGPANQIGQAAVNKLPRSQGHERRKGMVRHSRGRTPSEQLQIITLFSRRGRMTR